MFCSVSIANDLSHSPVIGLLDTGVSFKAFDSQKAVLKGFNVLEHSNETGDIAGHGTDLARMILKVCPSAKILPIKVSRLGGAIDAGEVAEGLMWAVKNGATILNLSFGILSHDEKLNRALDQVSKLNVPVVTAAGFGVPNPYKPTSLSLFLPQSHASSIVVGMAETVSKADTRQNFGPELDAVVLPKDEFKNASSSLIAAWMSAEIACGKYKAKNPAELRAAIRSDSLQSEVFDADHFGYGILSNAPLVPPSSFRVYATGADLNFSKEILKLDLSLKLNYEILKKGRARIFWITRPTQELRVKVTFKDHSQTSIKVPYGELF